MTFVAVSVISYWEIAIKERLHSIEDVAHGGGNSA